MYGFYLSSCSWRVRAALYAKRIPFEERTVDIVKEKHQLTEQYRAISPSQKVPALVIDGKTLVESMAIIQYLDDTRPEPPLMPTCPLARAHVREICETIVSGIQPLQNIGIRSHFNSEEEYLDFAKYWTKRGLQTLEGLLSKTAHRCCVGDQITTADLCLVPQIYNSVTKYDKKEKDETEYAYAGEILQSKYPRGRTWRAMLAKDFPTVNNVYVNMLKEDLFHHTHPKIIKKTGIVEL